MNFFELPLSNAYKIEIDQLSDHRGFFSRLFCAEKFAEIGLPTSWPQCNNSFTRHKGTIRGLHFQYPPKAETKLVRCINGVVFDVIVDLRINSSTFGQWHAELLDSNQRSMICVPNGFAHGFQALTPNAELLYFVSCPYSPKHEGGLNWADPSLSIKWPLELAKISSRDSKLPTLTEIKHFPE